MYLRGMDGFLSVTPIHENVKFNFNGPQNKREIIRHLSWRDFEEGV